MQESERDWSWLGDPTWMVPFLVGGAILALFMLPPLRHLWREVKVALAGGGTALVGVLVGLVHEPARDPFLMVGMTMGLVAFWLFVGAPGRHGGLAGAMGEDDAAPRDVDHSVAPHDIDDPETAALYAPKERQDRAPAEDPGRFHDESAG